MKRGPVLESPANNTSPLNQLAIVLDLVEQPILVSDRTGRMLHINPAGKKRLESEGFSLDANFNLFSDLLRLNAKVILDQVENGEHRIDLKFQGRSAEGLARIQWLAETEWLVVRIEEREPANTAEQVATQHTVQELSQPAGRLSSSAGGKPPKNRFSSLRGA